MSFKHKFLSITLSSLCMSISYGAHAADTPTCEVDRSVKFGGMSWESNLVLTEVQRYIVEKGYGCKTEVLPTESIPAIAALQTGSLDVNTEVWENSVAQVWHKAEKTGKVMRSADLYQGGEAWFIPKYVAERLPDLKKASDLPKFKKDFIDPEEPNKGRFYGCPAGWGCEVVTSNLFKALALDKDFTLYQPGTGAAQKATLTSDYKRKKNIAFYYWYPTTLVSTMDLVKLELPAYDKEKQTCLTQPDCPNPQASDYPDNPVFTALNTDFSKKAPKLAEFFAKNKIPLPVVDKTLAHLEETGDDPADVAKWFLKTQPDTWSAWVPADVAERVKSTL